MDFKEIRLTEKDKETLSKLNKKYEEECTIYDKALLDKQFDKAAYYRGRLDIIVDVVELIRN